MKNPSPVHMTTTQEVRESGWIAEARDGDGHLMSMQGWQDELTTNANIVSLEEFVAVYGQDYTVTVFADLVAAKLIA